MSFELQVTIKDSERTLRQQFLLYDKVEIDPMGPIDPKIKECIDETAKSFDGEPDDIILKLTMVYQ